MKETLHIVLKFIKIRMMKKCICFLLVFSFINAHSQDSTSKQKSIIYKSWPGYKLNGRMLKEKELKAELYKVPAGVPYYQKAHTSKIIGLSLIPPAILFALLSKPNGDISGSYKAGYGVASIFCAGASIFFVLRSSKNKKKAVQIYNKNIP